MAKKTHEKTPHAKMLLIALRSVGYTNETAIADILDNSVSGAATEIELYFDWDNRRMIIADNGFDNVKKQLAELLFGASDIIKRWDNFLKKIKGMGPATISELLSYYFPDEYMIFNGTTVKALNFLEVPDLPKYNYQYTGKRFIEVCKIGKLIAVEMKKNGIQVWGYIRYDKCA